MRTLLYPDGRIPKPFLVNNRDNDYTLYILSAVLILFFWCWILWHYTASEEEAFGQCNQGECATNVSTGQKRCPNDANSYLLYDLKTEVCNPATSCTSSRTPYAINTDGSFNADGICEKNFTCRCSAKVGCPNFTEVLFTRTSSTGKLYSPDFYFTQTIRDSDQQFENILESSCFIQITDTSRLNVGSCGAINNIDDVLECMKENPCISGNLTFVPEKGKTFDLNHDSFITSMACIAGPQCDDNSFALFDWTIGRTVCKSKT